MIRRLRYLLSDTGYWLRRHWAAAAVALVVLVGAGIGAYLAFDGDDADEEPTPAPAPPVVVREPEEPPPQPEEPAELGFPEFATKNTTRVAGVDPIADAAAVALAAFPSTGGLEGPAAVSLVDRRDWQSGVAAAALVAAPVGAPVLLTDGGEIPELTADAIAALDPRGSPSTADRQVFVIGAAAAPRDLNRLEAAGDDPAEVADSVDRLRQRLTGEDPAHLLIVSSTEPAYAMPAASWAARSGDPVLFVRRESVPRPTVAALRRHEDVPVYVLGPETAVSERTFDQIREIAPNAKRIAERGPVESAVAFARYDDGSFGWNINDPGHGFVIANSRRPLDAAASAPLSSGGTWGPLLVTDTDDELPPALRNYLLDLKPGYVDDPTRAIYNHVWLIGDASAISVPVQAQVDRLAEVAQVRSGSGRSVLGPVPGAPEPEDSGQP